MEIVFVDNCQSSQKLLIDGLKNAKFKAPCMLVAKNQSAGIGSRNNSWDSFEGNLFMSFALDESALPDDLAPQSMSVYFAFLFAQMLRDKGSKVWLKWPNDLYLEQKIGGIITTKTRNFVVCGIGLNIVCAPKNAEVLDIKCEAVGIAKDFAKYLKNLPKWKEILSKYLLEFQKSKKYSVHIDGKSVLLENAELQSDASIIINGKKVFSLR